MKIILGFSVSLILIFFTTGCATIYNPATGRNEWIFISDEQEVDIGQGVVKEVVRKYPLLDDSAIQNYVQQVGVKIAKVCDRANMPYSFKVIDDQTINAFACPGGFIYIHKGLLDKLDQDELAFVLAHEVGHVAARHAVKRLQANLGFQMLLTLAFIGSGSSDSETGRSVADFSADIYNLVSLGYSREDEFLADSLGIKYAKLAGFNSQAAVSALKKLKKEEKALRPPPFLSSHPPINERIIKAERQVEEIFQE